MKRYLKDFEITIDLVEKSIYDCLNGKWKRSNVIIFLAQYVDMPYKEAIKFVKEQIKIDKTNLFSLVNKIAKELYQEIVTKTINFIPIKYSKRIDKCSKKERIIGIQSVKQQCYDYIAVNICRKMFDAKIGKYQCASIKNKGQSYGKSTIESWIRTNPRKCKWIFKADVKKYYPSVNHDKLKELLKRDIKNDTVLYILYTLIDSYKEGICIGSYLSQYLGNYYLSYAYHYVSEFLYTTKRNKRVNLVNHVLFYMDDILLIGSNKKYVKKASKELQKYLKDKLLLELKQNYQLFPLDSRPIDMLGFKIYRNKTTIRKSIFKRLKINFKKARKRLNMNLACKIISYYGYLKNSFSKKIIDKNKDLIRKSREVISYASSRIYGNAT